MMRYMTDVFTIRNKRDRKLQIVPTQVRNARASTWFTKAKLTTTTSNKLPAASNEDLPRIEVNSLARQARTHDLMAPTGMVEVTATRKATASRLHTIISATRNPSSLLRSKTCGTTERKRKSCGKTTDDAGTFVIVVIDMVVPYLCLSSHYLSLLCLRFERHFLGDERIKFLLCLISHIHSYGPYWVTGKMENGRPTF